MNSIQKLMSYIDKDKIVEARQALRDIRQEEFNTQKQWYFFQANELEVKIDRIYFYIWETSLEAIKAKDRKEAVLFKRQIGIYCLYTSLKFTDTQVGEIFDRDRTTVLHSVKEVRKRLQTSNEARRKVHHFRRLLNEALGQMEIESIKKQENPENIGVLPRTVWHLPTEEKPPMSIDQFKAKVGLPEHEETQRFLRKGFEEINEIAGEILVGKSPDIFCSKIKESKNQESEQNRDNQR